MMYTKHLLGTNSDFMHKRILKSHIYIIVFILDVYTITIEIIYN